MTRHSRGARGRGAALLLGGSLLAVALIVWAAGARTASTVRADIARSSAARASGDEPRALESQAASDAARLEVDAPALGAANATAPAGALIVIEPAPERGVPIRVLRGRTDEAVPHAIVSYGEHRNYLDDSVLELRSRGASLEASVRSLQHFAADADGVVLVPRTSTFGYAFCAQGDDWGWVQLESEPSYDPIPLRLLPDADVVVRVVTGPERTPLAGADVALVYEIDPEDVSTLDTRTTDANGIARFEHIRQHTAYYWAHSEKISVELAGVFAEPGGVVFDPEDVPELIELEAHALTALDVTVVGVDGQVVSEPVRVSVGPDTDDPERAAREVSRVAYGGHVAIEQLGPSLDVRVRGETRLRAGTAVLTLRTASASGARLPVTLVLGEPPASLRARMLLPDGTPLAETELSGTIGASPKRWRTTLMARTDADGSLRLAHRLLGSEGVIGLEIRVKEGFPELSSTLSIDGPVVGERDLGDLRFDQAPVLVTGRVSDENGAPVADATVQVTGASVADGADESLASALTDVDGRFVAYGRTPGSTVRVSPHHALYGDADARFVAPGAHDVELVLQSGGGIAGGVLLDHEWLCDFVVARARPSDQEDGEEDWDEAAWLERPGFFSFRALKPGRWDVRVTMEDEEDLGLTIEDVEVVAGKVTRDPRLQAVDMRGRVGVRTYHVIDDFGEPISDGRLMYRAAGALEWSGDLWFERGEAHVFTMLAELDLYVTAQGKRSAFVPRAHQDRDILLAPGIPVRFYRSEPIPATETRFVVVALSGNEPAMPRVDVNVDVSVPEPDDVTYVPHGGDYQIAWQCITSSGEGAWRHVKNVEETLTIRERAEPQDVLLTVPAEALAFLNGAE